MIGRPKPTASFTSPRASVSLIPPASLLIVLNVAGAITNASGGGNTSGSSGCLKCTRTGWPVSSASWPTSRNLVPSGVTITHTSQSWPCAKRTNSGNCPAGRPPQAMTYSTGRAWLITNTCLLLSGAVCCRQR